ncbi:MAG: hypothetical protein WCC97_13605 [Candidatus Acidiferrales bacterium]
MKKTRLAMSLLICLVTTAYSQGETPQLMTRAAHCLEVKNFLPSSSVATLDFGYLLDEKSYPGDKVIYLVNFTAPARSNGLVFAVFVTVRDGVQHFNIQNNATFVLSKDRSRGVSFVDPPLGGTWTQQHLASAIKRIEKQPRFTIAVESLLATDASIRCESYTEPDKR